MNQQFIPLTPSEMFFGIIPKSNLPNGGLDNSSSMIPNVASISVNELTATSPNISIKTDVIAQQQAAFIFSDFLWKYRWPIGIGIIVVAGIYINNSIKKSEEKKRLK